MGNEKRKWNKRQLVCLVLMLIWMVVIFCFSARNGEESVEDSIEVGLAVCHLFVPGFQDMSQQQQYELAKKIDHPVRKTAHATEYMILSIISFGVFCPTRSQFEKKEKRLWMPGVCGWGIATLYACTDEFHQLFVPGRAGMVKDVLIDSSGALAGGILVTLCLCLVYAKKKKKQDGGVCG